MVPTWWYAHGHANGSHARIRKRVTTQKYIPPPPGYYYVVCPAEEFVASLFWSKEYFPKCNQEWFANNSKQDTVLKKIRSSVFIFLS